jgi:outer membrane immunogenic protein
MSAAMRKTAAAASILLTIGGTAFAADLPLAPPPPPPSPIVSWSGFYLGVNAGGVSGTSDNNYSIAGGPAFASLDNPLAGAVGGAQLGYNWQFWRIVYGLETDFQGSSARDSITTPCLPALCGLPLTASYGQELPWFGTVRGRVGFTSAGWLLYATGGYAYGRLDTNASATAGAATASLSTHDNLSGWTVGGGIEVEVAPRWSVKAEYLYVDLGRASHSWVFPGVVTVNDSVHVTENVMRAGLNFRF